MKLIARQKCRLRSEMKLDRCRIQAAAPFSGTAEVRPIIGGSYGASGSVMKTLRSMKWNAAITSQDAHTKGRICLEMGCAKLSCARFGCASNAGRLGWFKQVPRYLGRQCSQQSRNGCRRMTWPAVSVVVRLRQELCGTGLSKLP